MSDRRQEAVARIGASFRELRLKQGWTQSALANRAKVSRDTINRLERGQVVGLASLVALLDAMGFRLAFEPAKRLRAADMRRLFAHVHEEGDA